MSSLCGSNNNLNQQYHLEIQPKTHRRVRSQQLPNPEFYHNSPYENDQLEMYHHQSAIIFHQPKNKSKNRGLRLTKGRGEKKQLKGKGYVEVRRVDTLGLFQEMRPPNSAKTVSNIITENYQAPCENSAYQQAEQYHKPHPLIARHHPLPPTPRIFKLSTKQHNTAKPANKPNLDLLNFEKSIKNQHSTKANSQNCCVCQTPRKQKKDDVRHSQETASNRNSRSLGIKEGNRLKKGHIFDRTLTANLHQLQRKIHQLERKKSQISTPVSPTRAKKMLQDAKSIVSRDEESLKFQDFLFEESFMVDHELDIFTDILYIDPEHLSMAKAVDSRTGGAVTLRYFNQAQEKQYHSELQLIQLVQGLGSEQFPLKILKFKQTLVSQQQGHKQIIFVHQPFVCTFQEYLYQLAISNKPVHFHIGTVVGQLQTMLQMLALNAVVLSVPLKQEDLCWLTDDWCLTSLSKFRLDTSKIGHVQRSWMVQLKNELQMVIR